MSYFPRTLFVAILFLSVTIKAEQLEVIGVLYEPTFTNCHLATAFIQLSAPSLATCAAICTTSSTHKAFSWREGRCRLMEECPICCSSTNGGTMEGNVYCQKGEISTAVYDFIGCCSENSSTNGDTTGRSIFCSINGVVTV